MNHRTTEPNAVKNYNYNYEWQIASDYKPDYITSLLCRHNLKCNKCFSRWKRMTNGLYCCKRLNKKTDKVYISNGRNKKYQKTLTSEEIQKRKNELDNKLTKLKNDLTKMKTTEPNAEPQTTEPNADSTEPQTRPEPQTKSRSLKTKELIQLTGSLYHQGFKFWVFVRKDNQTLLNKIPEIILDKTQIILLDDYSFLLFSSSFLTQYKPMLEIMCNQKTIILNKLIEELDH